MPGASPQSGMTETPLASGLVVQLLLLQHDLGVAAEVGEVAADFDRGARHGRR